MIPPIMEPVSASFAKKRIKGMGHNAIMSRDSSGLR